MAISIANVHAFSLTPDWAAWVLSGKKEVILLNRDYSDLTASRWVLHCCNYPDPQTKKEGQKLIREQALTEIPEANTFYGMCEIKIIKHDDKTFKVDAYRHGRGASLNAFLASRNTSDWEDGVFQYEFSKIISFYRPVTEVGFDCEDSEIWEPETPFEELCFKLAAWQWKDITGNQLEETTEIEE